MGIALILSVFAVGAIVGFAVHADPSGLSLPTVGLIFMLVGAIGFGVSVYRDRWRRHIVEESIETGIMPPLMFDDDIIVDTRAEPRQADVVVHEHVPVTHTEEMDWTASATSPIERQTRTAP
jgi:hypothetical protein